MWQESLRQSEASQAVTREPMPVRQTTKGTVLGLRPTPQPPEISSTLVSFLAERLAHPRRDGSLKIKLDACRRRMERLVGFSLMAWDVRGLSRALAETRQKPSTQPLAETPQRLGENLAPNLSRSLGKDSTDS